MTVSLTRTTSMQNLQLPSPLAHGAIIQADTTLTFTGKALGIQHIIFSLAGQKVECKVSQSGRWKINFQPFQAGGPHQLRVQADSETFSKVDDLWFGEVWLASGQSNMFWPLNRSSDAHIDINSAEDPLLRFYCPPKQTAKEPQETVDAAWISASPETVGDFSAVAYYFAQVLRKTTGRPVGVIQSAVGGTLISCWKSRETLDADPQTPIYQKVHEDMQSSYDTRLQAWQENGSDPDSPIPPADRQLPSGYFNAMIAPLTSYPIRGTIWYQGEGNNKNADNYERELTDLIQEWRRLWNRPEMPFYLVQLAGYEGNAWVDHNWPYLREAQTATWLHTSHTGMAVALDVGERTNIHPKKKKTVGERLALWARRDIHGEAVIPSGPMLRSTSKDGDKFRVHFNYAQGGLCCQPPGAFPTGFEIAGSDGIYHSAKATIDGETVLVFADDAPNPVYIRYGWAGFPIINLTNNSGLPAVPFRTDTTPFTAL